MAAMREARVTVRLSADEATRLDGLARKRGSSHAAALRALLRDDDTPAAVPTPSEALALLAESARDGSVAARVALARLLSRPDARTPVERRMDELAAKRRARRNV
jgi:hypothetical protein